MENNLTAVIELSCFPSICFFRTLKPYQKVALEAFESFPKQTYRNRFDILGPNGVQTLHIPIKKFANNTLYPEIEIDQTTNWQAPMLRTLKTTYAGSPYYEYYMPEIESIISSDNKLLFDFNLRVLKKINSWLHINQNLELTKSFQIVYTSESLDDLRDLKSKKRKSISDWNCDNPAYWQVFGKKFVTGLSILDLIFCEGPLSPKYI